LVGAGALNEVVLTTEAVLKTEELTGAWESTTSRVIRGGFKLDVDVLCRTLEAGRVNAAISESA
jgi:hypothetical protein